MHPSLENELKSLWGKRFPNCPPVPYLFKHRLGDRWLRIYSLPEGKRYPDDATEEREILSRYVAVLAEMIGPESPIKIVYGVFDIPGQNHWPKELDGFDFTPFDRISKNQFDPEEDDEEIFLDCFYAETSFEPGKLDGLFLAIAKEEISNLFVYDGLSNRIFAPYDGGADLIFEDVETRGRYSTIFADWASPRSDGL